MSIDRDPASRRSFLTDVGRLASTVALAGCIPATVAAAVSPAPGDWDLSWLDLLRPATDKAVFDWPSLGDPADAIVLQIAERDLETRPECGRGAGGSSSQPKASVEAYIASRANAQQRADCKALIALLKRLTGKPPYMWGPSIVGFGSYTYTYDSGHSGEAPLTGFAIRGRDLVVYLMAEDARQKALLAKVGKHKMGKSCFYFKQLADLDKAVLEQLVAGSIANVRKRYG